MKPETIDDSSAPGAWEDAIASNARREAANLAITSRNDRIKAAWGKEDVRDIAFREGVSPSYVEAIGKRWGA